MKRIRRLVAGLATIGILAGVTLPATAALPNRQIGVAAHSDGERIAAAGVPHSIFPSRDFGRRLSQALVSGTVTLRYNRQSELDALVRAQSDPRSPLYRHFLTSTQFDSYFAPTPQQQAYVATMLQAAGLRVTRTFPNRTLLDVVGTSAAAERFFHTEIHSISQGVYGERFANVTPVSIPANLASLVRTVSLSNIVIAKTGPHVASQPMLATALTRRRNDALAPGRFIVHQKVARKLDLLASSTVEDPGFESGAFGHGWNQCETQYASPLASITNTLANSGRYSGKAGSPTIGSREQFGFAGVCQLVKIPPGGILSAYLYQLSNDKYASLDGEDTFLLDTHGNLAAVLASSANDHAGWVRNSWNLSSYAGRDLYLYFGVHGDGNAYHHTQQYVDDVSLSASGPTPSPTATPTPSPTATPTQSPTATPTPSPTATPTPSPTATPTPSPTATATPTPLPTATATPTPSPTATPTPSPTTTPTPSPTTTPTSSPTTTPTSSPTATPTPSPTATPTPSPTATPTPSPTATPTPSPTATPTPSPTATPTASPTASPTATPTASSTATPTPLPTATPTCGQLSDAGPLSNEFGYLATGVADAFDYPVQHGCNGAGITVAVVIDSPVNASDIAAYLKAAGVSESGAITTIKIDGGCVGRCTSGNLEASLDVETIAGLAPGANILLYDLPDLSDQSIYDGYNQTINDNVATVTNSSFAGCETADGTFDSTTETLAEQAASKGITFVASSGDSGSDECANGNKPPLPATPSGDPYFVSVGGDNFTESGSGKLLTLTATGDPASEFLSGGGVSTVFDLPIYQEGVPNVIKSGRNQPDVSLPGVGTVVYYENGGITSADGTSWASPCFVALLAEASELGGGTRFGFLNPTMYGIFYESSYMVFTDVTTGSNGYYHATSGYDQVTGIGAPKGYAFAQGI